MMSGFIPSHVNGMYKGGLEIEQQSLRVSLKRKKPNCIAF